MMANARSRALGCGMLLALVLLLVGGVYLFTLPSCRTHSVVLANDAAGAIHIELATVSNTDKGTVVETLWNDDGNLTRPREIPFALFGEGRFRIEVRYEGRPEPVVREFAYITPHTIRTFYVVVGDDAILDFYAFPGGFDSPDGREHVLASFLGMVRYTVTDALSCLDGA